MSQWFHSPTRGTLEYACAYVSHPHGGATPPLRTAQDNNLFCAMQIRTRPSGRGRSRRWYRTGVYLKVCEMAPGQPSEPVPARNDLHSQSSLDDIRTWHSAYLAHVRPQSSSQIRRTGNIHIDIHFCFHHVLPCYSDWDDMRLDLFWRGLRIRCGKRSSSSPSPTVSVLTSARSPNRSAMPNTKSTLA